MTSGFGIDYASVDGNKPPDLAAAKAAGLRFAIVRGSYSTWQDPTCSRDRAAIRAAGLTFGAYLFPVMNAGAPTPEEQVRQFLQHAELEPSRDFAGVLDLEWPGGIAKTGKTRIEIANWIRRAVAEFEHRTGCKPIVYSSARVLDGNDTDSLAGAADRMVFGCPAWCARYPFKTRIPAVTNDATVDALPRPPVPRALGDADGWWIWQYQGDAIHLPGFSATVDMDEFNLLRHGAKGTRVSWVQRRVGVVEGTPGVWTDAMDDAVKSFQQEKGLVADGVIGPATFAALTWVPV